MPNRTLVTLSVLATVTCGLAAAAPAPASAPGVTAAAAFEHLASLSGTWEGTVVGEGGPVTVTYRTISGGRAVLETLFPGTEHEMLSIYLVDGDELRMTHYCAMGNQPHMRLDRKASTAGELRFVFEGGTNLDPAKDMHVHNGTITFAAGGTMTAAWSFNKDGKPAGQHAMTVSRAPGSAAAAAQ